MTNSDKALPEVEIDFGGEKRKAVFSTLAFCLLEETTGKNALDGDFWVKPDVRMLTTMIWAGLKTNYPELTLDEVRSKLSLGQLNDCLMAVVAGFAKASPPADEKKTA